MPMICKDKEDEKYRFRRVGTSYFTTIKEIVQVFQTETGYYYFEVGGGGFNRPTRIWVNKRLVRDCQGWGAPEDKNYYVVLQNVQLIKTEKGNYVLRPGEDTLFIVYVECGFRGSARAEIDNVETLIEQEYWHSQRASLGADAIYLVKVVDPTKPIIINASRTGRTYGNPKKETVVINIQEKTIKYLEGLDLEDASLLE